ncbi:MAG: hypothetical protein NZ480_01535, partial [Bdellovibrionaceae bacterium]|nr:hypothetical protein [Pseudobdellovibrionaceae bacterium]
LLWTPLLYLVGWADHQGLQLVGAPYVFLLQWGSALVMTFFMMYSDWQDFLRGWDHFKPQNYNVLTSGEIHVRAYRRVFWGIGVLCLFIGYKVIPLLRWDLIFVILIGVLCIGMWLFSPIKTKAFGDSLLTLLFGPLVTGFFSLFLYQKWGMEELLLGVVWGLGTLFYYQAERFQFLVSDSRERRTTTLVVLGFERAKQYVLLLWFLFTFLSSLWHFLFQLQFQGVIYGIIGLMGMVILVPLVQKANTPLGFNNKRFLDYAIKLFYLVCYFWVLEGTIYLL